jgi:hypothetical protein
MLETADITPAWVIQHCHVLKSDSCKFFASGNTGVQAGGWFNKEINSREDYKGLKMRISGLGGEVVAARRYVRPERGHKKRGRRDSPPAFPIIGFSVANTLPGKIGFPSIAGAYLNNTFGRKVAMAGNAAINAKPMI